MRRTRARRRRNLTCRWLSRALTMKSRSTAFRLQSFRGPSNRKCGGRSFQSASALAFILLLTSVSHFLRVGFRLTLLFGPSRRNSFLGKGQAPLLSTARIEMTNVCPPCNQTPRRVPIECMLANQKQYYD
jgi:hypothetical protein